MSLPSPQKRLNSSAQLDFWNRSLRGFSDLSADDAASVPVDSSLGLRVFISFVYSVVCAVGLLGNALVMHLIWAWKDRPTPAINVFVFGLAVADFQFALTLPFWAVETALDFSWPFGTAMCKLVTTLTVLGIYANAFLLTAMGVIRYWSVVSALKSGSKMTAGLAKWVTLALWLLALAATVPTTTFAMVTDVAGVKLCLLKFPTNRWLGVYHIQRVVLAFLIPLGIISTSYLHLLSFLWTHRVNVNNPKRQNQIATSVRLVICSFFICWFPNYVVTIWGVLVKFRALPFDDAYYFLHTYIFPVTTCLAHSNSCLNPVIYSLMRKEFRRALKDTFWKISLGLHPKDRGWVQAIALIYDLEPPLPERSAPLHPTSVQPMELGLIFKLAPGEGKVPPPPAALPCC
uniref:G-protein coupled receptors family 1 profile domain-containing protein n=1 Tax=Sphenodon punctatus TaxID=8508 RepID=A0A8D0GAR8_SPHPU